jgi:excinuclease ABC subunit A
VDVGLDYLTLNRVSGTLSGGESQRIRLATQIGSALMGVLYICDEPSIGLHPVDGDRLIATLERLRDLGNTVLIVEHDEAMMRAADWIIDMGPGAGVHGGELVAEGSMDDIMAAPRSITGAYLSGSREIPPRLNDAPVVGRAWSSAVPERTTSKTSMSSSRSGSSSRSPASPAPESRRSSARSS